MADAGSTGGAGGDLTRLPGPPERRWETGWAVPTGWPLAGGGAGGSGAWGRCDGAGFGATGSTGFAAGRRLGTPVASGPAPARGWAARRHTTRCVHRGPWVGPGLAASVPAEAGRRSALADQALRATAAPTITAANTRAPTSGARRRITG